MRNLKRALSLAVASVMLLGMMVVGAGAASYPDVDNADQLEAIEIMKAIGAMVGDDKGNFNPDTNVTRNEMAVVMTHLLGLDPDDYSTVSIPFTDVPAWARDFVAACYANGIISGTSATTFGGSTNVTAAQAGLMMMKALGYFQYQSDFGDDWQLASIRQASKIDLFKGIASNATTALNRNNVARLGLNALKADVVEANGTPGTDITTTDGTVINVGNTVKYDPVDNTTHNYNYAASTSTDYEHQQLAEKLYGNDLRVNTNNADNFGRPANRWTYKAREIGAYAKEATMTYVEGVKSSQIYSDLGLSSNHTANYTVDGQTTGTWLVGKSISTKTSATTGGIPGVGTGTSVEVYYDVDADSVDIIAINTYAGEVTNVYPDADEPYIVISGFTITGGDFETTGYEVDDIVLFTTDGIDVQSVALAEKVTDAELTAYTGSTKITAGGTTYSRNVNSHMNDGLTVDSSYDLYLDANGYVIYTELYEAGANNYAYVLGSSKVTAGTITQDTWTMKLLFTDGTVATVATDYDANDPDLKGTWVSFAEDDGVYSVYAKTTNGTEAATKIENGKSAMQINGSTYYANSNTVVIVKETGTNSYKAYVGVENMPTVASSGSAFTPAEAAVHYNAGNVAKYVYIETAAANVTSDTDGVIYVSKASKSGQKTDSRGTYYTYDAVIDGEITSIDVSGSLNAGGFTNGVLSTDAKLGSISYNGKDLVTGASAYSLGSGETQISGTGTTRYEDGLVGLTGNGYYSAGKDVQVYYLDSDGNFTESTFASVRNDSNDTYYALLKDGQVKSLYITRVNVTTPAVSATLAGTTLTVNVSNYASCGTLTVTTSVTGGAAVGAITLTSGVGSAAVTGVSGQTGYITVTVTNTVVGVGSANAQYVVAYTIP